MLKRNKRGVILFIVIGVIIVSAMLAVVILRIISNQSRLTHHQLSRIQAQYAAKAGVLFALDKLRLNDTANGWNSVGTINKKICKSLTSDLGCNLAGVIIDSDLPNTIRAIDIAVEAPGSGVSGTRKVRATAIYTYTP